MSVHSEILPVGAVIGGRYRIELCVGTGGMGAVYAAEHAGLGKLVAIKVLHPEYAQNKEYRARFEREARVCSRLRHPSAVAVHDFGEHEGMLYLVMDLLSGRSLRREIGELPPGQGLLLPRVYHLGGQLADVLTAAHALPLVHRDLKPENVIIEPDGGGGERAVLVDFGLAFIGDGAAELGRLTRSGAVPGTPHYVSPEQARALDLGPPSDIYSFGCMLFEMATGDPPFDAPTAAELVAAHLFVPAPSLRQVRPAANHPEALDDLLQAMLGKAAEHRPTAAEVAEALADLAAGGQKPVRSRPPRTRASRMIETPALGPPPTAIGPARLGWVGDDDAAPDELAVAAASNRLGLVRVPVGDKPIDVDIVLAIGRSAAEVKALVAHGRPVVATAPRTDMPRLLELLKAGAADVVAWPLDVDEAMTKVVRVLRAHRRRRDQA